MSTWLRKITFMVCCFVLLKPMLGNRYGPGVSSKANHGARIHKMIANVPPRPVSPGGDRILIGWEIIIAIWRRCSIIIWGQVWLMLFLLLRRIQQINAGIWPACGWHIPHDVVWQSARITCFRGNPIALPSSGGSNKSGKLKASP